MKYIQKKIREENHLSILFWRRLQSIWRNKKHETTNVKYWNTLPTCACECNLNCTTMAKFRMCLLNSTSPVRWNRWVNSLIIRHIELIQNTKRRSRWRRQRAALMHSKNQRTGNVTFDSAVWKPIKMHPWVRRTQAVSSSASHQQRPGSE